MQTLTGLFNGCVLQRVKGNISDALLDGECASRGDVKVRVYKGSGKLKKFDGIVCGRANGTTFKGVLRGLPAGGPYAIELWIEDRRGKILERCKCSNVLVGDVWLCAGQSNMQGVGVISQAAKPHPKVRAFYMDDSWRVAKDPIHKLWEAVDSVHNTLKGRQIVPKEILVGVSPAVAFGQEMLRRTGVPQGLIACAHGGTSMASWSPKNTEPSTLYKASIRRGRKNGGKIAGIIWYQGESDANPQAAEVYTPRMKELVAHFRKDFRQPGLPFVAVQIGRHIANAGSQVGVANAWNWIQDQQRRLHTVIRYLATVPSVDLTLDDNIHINGNDQNVLGRRMAEAADVLRRGAAAGRLPIDLKSVGMQTNKRTGGMDIVVEFANVRGKLRASGGYPTGFVLSDGSLGNHIYRVDLQGSKAFLRTYVGRPDAQLKQLCYGAGYNPYCNIVDDFGRPLPAISGVKLGATRAVTDFITAPEVSAIQPSAGKLETLQYPDADTLGFKVRRFSSTFCDLHLELGALAPNDVLVYFRTSFECPEAMRLALMVGYDGPLKIWIDGQEKFHDPNGTNPARPDDARVLFNAPAGKHEILVALASNFGAAWGICLHLERLDVTRGQLKLGREAYRLPALV
jgi:hypothetical protein